MPKKRQKVKIIFKANQLEMKPTKGQKNN